MHALQPTHDAPLYAIPLSDLGEGAFGSLPGAEQDYILHNLEVFKILAEAESLQREGRRQAALCRHLGRGWSAKAILDRFRLYSQGGAKANGESFAAHDWRALKRAYTNGLRADKVSAETRRFWRSIYAQFRGREDVIKAAYHHLIQNVWLAGEPVPGLPEDGDAQTLFQWWAERYPSRALPSGRIVRKELLPAGWSYDSFRRAVQPDTVAKRKLIRFGSFAAHSDWAAQLLRDRSRLRPLECILFDDVRFDHQVLAQDEQGKWQAAFPVGLVAIDLATGCDLGLALMPRLQREDGSHHGITRDGLRLLVYQILTQFGLPPWPVRLVVEKAAAALAQADQRFLQQTIGDRLEIKETAMTTFQRLQGGVAEKHGRPWDKGWIEAYFRPLQTHLAGLPGQTGNRYDNSPGDLAATVKTSLALCARAQSAGVPIHALRQRLRTFDEFHRAALEAMRLLRWRTDHNLQGFEEVFEGRTEAGAYLAITDGREIPAEVVEISSRPEAPVERMRRLMVEQNATFAPVPAGALWPLLATKHPVTIRGGRVRVDVQGLKRKVGTPTDALIYFDPDAEWLTDPRHQGAKLDGYFTDDARLLHVIRDGALLGSLPLQTRADLTDPAALATGAAAVAHARNAELAELRAEYLAPAQAQQALAATHDSALIAAAAGPTLAADLAQAEATAARKASRPRPSRITLDDLADDLGESEDSTTTAAAFDDFLE